MVKHAPSWKLRLARSLCIAILSAWIRWTSRKVCLLEIPVLAVEFATNVIKDDLTQFRPHPLVRQGDLQTLLSLIEPAGARAVALAEQPILLDAGVDHTQTGEQSVRLLAFYTPQQTKGPRRGLVMLLHGWEGCSHANFNLVLGSTLIQHGYDVVRLNLRDHGATHHLNRGIFYATLIEEAVAVTHQVAQMAAAAPFFIVGPSLGGNFALRLAIQHADQSFHHLRHVIAINPVLHPDRTAAYLDRHPVYSIYYRKRWLASLRRKQAHFPDLYDFAELAKIASMRAMTDWLVARFGPYQNAEEYFAAYAISVDDFCRLSVPTTIIMAADDPIISVEDFYDLPPHPLLDVQIHPHGGHVGFIEIFPLRHRLPDMVLAVLERTLNRPQTADHGPLVGERRSSCGLLNRS